MQAKVISTTDGKVTVEIRRSRQRNQIYYRDVALDVALEVGDIVEVKREPNNPYLRLVPSFPSRCVVTLSTGEQVKGRVVGLVDGEYSLAFRWSDGSRSRYTVPAAAVRPIDASTIAVDYRA